MINYLTVAMSARKVLIMEPNDCAFLGISHILRDVLGLNSDHVPDCPNALKQIRDALKKSSPYDLLITELSGTERGNETRELIKEATGIQPALRTLLYTSEVRPLALKTILRDPRVNGYVLKNGHGSSQLVKAIRNIGKSGFYSIVIHGCEQNLTCSSLLCLESPGFRHNLCRCASAMGMHHIAMTIIFCIDGYNYTLTTKL